MYLSEAEASDETVRFSFTSLVTRITCTDFCRTRLKSFEFHEAVTGLHLNPQKLDFESGSKSCRGAYDFAMLLWYGKQSERPTEETLLGCPLSLDLGRSSKCPLSS